VATRVRADVAIKVWLVLQVCPVLTGAVDAKIGGVIVPVRTSES
jgi:hypothetical protein